MRISDWIQTCALPISLGSLASISVEEPWIAPSGGVKKVARSSGTRAAIACAAAISLGSLAEVMKIGCGRYCAARPTECLSCIYSPGENDSTDRKSTTSELQSLMRISYAVFCLKKKKQTIT